MKPDRWFALCLALTLTACGPSVSPGTAILSLEELPDGFEGPDVVDNIGTSVTIEFAGGVPTVCNVAYGMDVDYGSLATMPMMGGAVRDHAVTLTGLTPNTGYHYRITLTDEQARVYQSQDFTFTTAAGVEGAGIRENVAALSAGARVIGVSSNWGGGGNAGSYGASRAFDEQPGTEWSSDGDGDGAWIEIELAQTYEVHTIGLWTRRMSDGTAQILSFSITTDQGETFGPFDLPDANRVYTFPVQFAARTLRFDAVETSGGNTGAVEIGVYGTPLE
ncbi:MAG: discoidin domain-containing protein [Anaerolineae bacterium]|jgi:hypothetical protein